MLENLNIQDKGGFFGGIAKSIGSLFGGRARRRRERTSQKEFASALDAYKTSEISNPYEDITNPFVGLTNELDDLQVATQAAEFQSQQVQQGLAQSLDAFRGAGGGTGAAAIATALAQEQRRSMQGIAADIARQEVENTRAARQADMNIQRTILGTDLAIQQARAAGETDRQTRELDRRGDIAGIAASESAAATEARQKATSDLFGGLGEAAQGLFGG